MYIVISEIKKEIKRIGNYHVKLGNQQVTRENTEINGDHRLGQICIDLYHTIARCM